ncbi:protein trichome birefringence-like 3 isoform X1 [Canna indica]|uniref:Protein trichome birefringence-like 3 isoform X1 n=1 Tax=Canna indica TaxID=4628 RepID=A0AAQ3KKC5_9LILI|nr:protein trichome birefringence-like 3 isoform X1 [Canna indica]
MKISRGKLPLSLMAVVISAVALIGMIFTEDLRALTGTSLLMLKASSKKAAVAANSTKLSSEEREKKAAVDVEEDKVELVNGGECSVSEGRWVFNSSREIPYSDRSCPYLDKQVACLRNGRPDDNYLYWEWELDDCTLPKFNPGAVLEKLRGKRLMFVGDSLQREQWQSFVCLVQSHIPQQHKSMNKSRPHSVFKLKEYNATIEFYWAPFLVQSNTDGRIISDTRKRIIRVDSITKHAQHWLGVDILVFNTYMWWMSGQRIKSLWGSFDNGEEGYEELDVVVAYRISLKTWANWIDSTINPNSTRVFFSTVSPAHIRSSDWHRKKGIKCYNESMPVMERGYWGSGSDRRMMEVVRSVVGRMKVPVTFLNITQLSEYRIDGHTSVYTEFQGKVLSDEQKANPKQYADCIHWCLPGVPDTWNRLFYAYL